jgi:uncharacterized protein (DUF1800 family)
MTNYTAEIAVNRFGMGARAGELASAQSNPLQWLMSQLTPIVFDKKVGDLARAQEMLERYAELKKEEKSKPKPEKKSPKNLNKQDGDNSMGNGMNAKQDQPAEEESKELKDYRKDSGDMILAMEMESLQYAITAKGSFTSRLLDFFSNHFSVTGQGIEMRVLAPLLEREAIAPNLVGQFSDMLLAVEQHPSMLIYLNNEKSIGPDSPYGKKSKKGLNENLGREILELHTLGVHGGYTQTDVRELAMAITGWSVVGKNEQGSGFVFRDKAHQPGTRKVLGKSYAQDDVKQGEAILKDLAHHPSTAKYVSFKLARHFIADKPSELLVEAMTKKWLETQGNIKSVVKTMFEHPDSWLPAQQKYKSPREFVVSTLRVVDSLEPLKFEKLKVLQSLSALGQQPFNAGSPAGYGDVSSAWDGAEALMARIEWVNQVASRIKVQALPLLEAALGKQVTENTLKQVRRAESRQQGLVLALMSPEFQRR